MLGCVTVDMLVPRGLNAQTRLAMMGDWLRGKTRVRGKIKVSGKTRIRGKTKLSGKTWVRDKIRVIGARAKIYWRTNMWAQTKTDIWTKI